MNQEGTPPTDEAKSPIARQRNVATLIFRGRWVIVKIGSNIGTSLLTWDCSGSEEGEKVIADLRVGLSRVGGPDTSKPDWRVQPWDQQR
jgi:hypothetical protein